jgi:hypothetical protein
MSSSGENAMAETIFTPAEFEGLASQLEANITNLADRFATDLTPLLREAACAENAEELMRETVSRNVKELLLASTAQTCRLFEQQTSDVSAKIHAGELQHLADDAEAAGSLAMKLADRLEANQQTA